MKKNYFIIVALTLTILISKVSAQSYVPFPDSNAVWRTVHFNESFCIPPDFCKYEETINGDTIINTLVYHKLFERSNDDLTYHYIAALREESKRIYIISFNCSQEILFYDFNLAVGDTINVPFELAACGSMLDSLILVSIDSVLINNEYRRKFNMFDFEYLDYSFWIEGIGSSHGLFYPGIPHVVCTCVYNLTCFEQNNILLYADTIFYGNCDPLTNILEKKEQVNNIIIYPNPVSDIIYIQIREPATLEIINMQGQIVSTCSLPDKTNTINISNLSPGLYNLRIISKNGIVYRKIVKD